LSSGNTVRLPSLDAGDATRLSLGATKVRQDLLILLV
jgi:hypothetical protein